MDGAHPHPESFPPQRIPGMNPYGGEPLPYPEQVPPQYGQPYPPQYPAALPPPVPYPPTQRKVGKRALLIAAAVVVVAALIGGVLFAVTVSGGRGLSAANAKSTIQGYLDALVHQDKQAIARHALCGLYDEVKDRSTDLTVANLASDAFRRQFSAAEVTSIDKIVMLSPDQAQVLFTMKVTPSGRGSQSSRSKSEIQAVAQILTQPGESLVCSYLPRSSDSE